jgi:RNA polymerase sigma factor (sigma-70 family)
MRKAPECTSSQLKRLFVLGTVAGMTDSQLLEQFVSADNESAGQAFEAIVKRHGPMVFGVCRMVLQDVHAAEDAFQATFLVLARKAPRLRASELLGNWLYGVALRTARKTKASVAHRRDRNLQAAVWKLSLVESPQRDQGYAELERVLHEEIDRLPYSYRTAIILCYLEGLSQSQAARQLHLTESTVRGRLARARKLLGQRLTRRGIGPCAGLTVLENSTHAYGSVPKSIAEVVVQSALCFVNRSPAMPAMVSTTIRGVAEGVLLTMWYSPLKAITAIVLAVTLLTAGISLIAERSSAARVEPERSHLTAAVEGKSAAALLELAQAGSTNSTQQRIKTPQETPPAQENADLVKLTPGPIVRTVPLSKDCMVLSYLPDWNFGNVDNIGIGNNDGGVRTLLDWQAIPPEEASSPNRRFLIALYSRETISHPPASAIGVYEILEEWPEQTSWKTQPTYATEPVATSKFRPGDGWKLFDVTSMVRARAKAGRDGQGVVLRFLNEDVTGGLPEVFSDYKLVSREAVGKWADYRPVLVVVKASGSSQVVPQEGSKQVQEPVKKRQQPNHAHVDQELIKLAAGPIVRVLPVSRDCMVLSYLPDWNFGNVDNIGIGNNDGGVHTLLDWPPLPPEEATALDRRFLIALYSRKTISHPPASVINVYEILEEWPERTSWRTQPGYEKEPMATCDFKPGAGWKVFDVTSLVRARATVGRNGHGIVLKFLIEDVSSSPPEVFSDYKLVSREGVGRWADYRPLLLIVEAAGSPKAE